MPLIPKRTEEEKTLVRLTATVTKANYKILRDYAQFLEEVRMRYLGDDGYMRLTAAARRACLELADAIVEIPELQSRARPDARTGAIQGGHSIKARAQGAQTLHQQKFLPPGFPAPPHVRLRTGREASGTTRLRN